jgi:hypothetical protein
MIPEAKHHAPNTPMILVGLMSDLRSDTEYKKEHKCITVMSDCARQAEWGYCLTYIETSAKTTDGCDALLQAITDARNVTIVPKEKKKCKMM